MLCHPLCVSQNMQYHSIDTLMLCSNRKNSTRPRHFTMKAQLNTSANDKFTNVPSVISLISYFTWTQTQNEKEFLQCQRISLISQFVVRLELFFFLSSLVLFLYFTYKLLAFLLQFVSYFSRKLNHKTTRVSRDGLW